MKHKIYIGQNLKEYEEKIIIKTSKKIDNRSFQKELIKSEEHNINSDFISKLEGGHILKGYVPNPISSKSGVTISVGFDLGARNKNDILGFKQEIQIKFYPYLGLQKHKSSIKFHELPSEAQTVIASIEYQYGSAQSKAPTFWKYVTNQKWEETIKELENFGDGYPTKRKKEALYLKEIL